MTIETLLLWWFLNLAKCINTQFSYLFKTYFNIIVSTHKRLRRYTLFWFIDQNVLIISDFSHACFSPHILFFFTLSCQLYLVRCTNYKVPNNTEFSRLRVILVRFNCMIFRLFSHLFTINKIQP